jgi:UDP-4-amino-4-deoxy-L-arabinose formyltransferase/UDP-glucuronic acid dehydrogenase (UDP-4-keto-hexauronic acid decarboxylating)
MNTENKLKNRVMIVGRTRMLHDATIMLDASGYRIAGIITAKAAQGYDCCEEDYKELANRLDVPFLYTQSLDDPQTVELLDKADADIGVSVNWVGIVDAPVISKFRMGILNAHLGDIPRFRGNACPNWAIIKGEKEVVLSVHFMEAGRLDCGRVILQDKRPLGDDTYISDVYKWASDAIPKAFVKALDMIADNPGYMLKYADPDAPESFRCYPRTPEDGRIDWDCNAVQIHRLIRASAEPHEGAFTFYRGKRMSIWRACPVIDRERYCAVPGQVCAIDRKNGEVTVATGGGKLLLTEVSLDSSCRIAPAEIIRSVRARLDSTQKWKG